MSSEKTTMCSNCVLPWRHYLKYFTASLFGAFLIGLLFLFIIPKTYNGKLSPHVTASSDLSEIVKDIRTESEAYYNRRFTELAILFSVFGIAIPLIMTFLQQMSFASDRRKIEEAIERANNSKKDAEEALRQIEILKKQAEEALRQIEILKKQIDTTATEIKEVERKSYLTIAVSFDGLTHSFYKLWEHNNDDVASLKSAIYSAINALEIFAEYNDKTQCKRMLKSLNKIYEKHKDITAVAKSVNCLITPTHVSECLGAESDDFLKFMEIYNHFSNGTISQL